MEQVRNSVSNSNQSATADVPLLEKSCPNYSLNEAINATVEDLLRLGYSPLPVVPPQDPFKYPLKKNGTIVLQQDGKTPKPLFNGKNPSYFDAKGEPSCIKHEQYRTRRPNESELKKWFSHPDIGIGTNGGAWVDFDLKHFNDAEHMEATVQTIVDRAEWVERTQSGGYRVAVAPGEKPQFTNFGIGEVAHAGELLNGGGFVVLAPTKGEKGDYVRLKSGDPLKVDRAEDLGLRPSSQHAANPSQPPAVTSLPEPPRSPQVQLLDLVSKKTNERYSIAESGNFEGDRSREIVALAQELYAWERLASEHGVTTDSADSLIRNVAEGMGIADKVQRCLKHIDRSTVRPALEMAKGIDICVSRLELKAGLKKPKKKPITETDTIFLTPDDSPGPIAHQYLFAEGYVRIEDSFYRYEETHFEKQDDRHIEALISSLFERCVRRVETEKSVIETRPYRTSAKVKDARLWALTRIPYIPLDEVNPPGVNCTNGVLIFPEDENGIPQPQLVEHSPDRVFTEPPQVAYHPEADDTHALRLLEAISPSYRDTVLKVFAAAINLDAVRKAKGRAVRSLIFAGSGANGKDALREVVTHIFGKGGLTSCTVDDFQAYDQGRRFNLAMLAGSRINWASENRTGANIDDIQSLKQMISGDPLVTEQKHQQGLEFTPRCVAIFATNDRAINLTASLEAIASRYAIVPFSKTFVTNPTKAHELKADPRFKYDAQWVRDEVCPAILNILIEKYQAIFAEGIDYAAFDKTMEENRIEVNHLLRFAQDMGLEEDTEGQVSTDTLWEKLRIWYEQEGILKVDESNRDHWEDDVRAGDSWVKGKQQLKRRLMKIFPTIESFRTKTERGIKGIRFVDPVEKALLAVETWGDYCRVVEFHGDSAVKDCWHKLTVEMQNKIVGLRPDVTTPEPQASEPEPLPDELTEEDIQEAVGMLEQAVKEGVPELLESFRAFPKAAQKRILHACPLDIQAGVKALKKQIEAKVT